MLGNTLQASSPKTLTSILQSGDSYTYFSMTEETLETALKSVKIITGCQNSEAHPIPTLCYNLYDTYQHKLLHFTQHLAPSGGKTPKSVVSKYF